MVTWWYQYGFNMVSIWYHDGDMILSWYIMILSWYIMIFRDNIMIFTWWLHVPKHCENKRKQCIHNIQQYLNNDTCVDMIWIWIGYDVDMLWYVKFWSQYDQIMLIPLWYHVIQLIYNCDTYLATFSEEHPKNSIHIVSSSLSSHCPWWSHGEVSATQISELHSIAFRAGL